jgi:hypothetical protein
MRHLTGLHLQNKLSENENLWFRQPKLAEELYDLENDPFELNNLSVDINYSDQIIKFNKILDDWLDEIDDLGKIPEKELVKMIANEK